MQPSGTGTKTIIRVKIADMQVARGEAVLMTVGLGSCVGVALYDEGRKVGGLAHILLGNSEDFPYRNGQVDVAKFADTATPALLESMISQGARKWAVRAKIAGGGHLFGRSSKEKGVGERNVEAVRAALKKAGIPLTAEDVGGAVGRTVKLCVDSGDFLVSTTDRQSRVL